jgi:hypothetical protein
VCSSAKFPGLKPQNSKALVNLKKRVAKHHKIANRAVLIKYKALQVGTEHDNVPKAKAEDFARAAMDGVNYFCKLVVDSRNAQGGQIKKTRRGKMRKEFLKRN